MSERFTIPVFFVPEMVADAASFSPSPRKPAEVVNPKALYVAEREAHERGQQTDMARQDPAAHRELLAAALPATVAMRIAVPPKLKDELQRLAVGAGKELSAYCREVLTAYFLGAARAASASG